MKDLEDHHGYEIVRIGTITELRVGVLPYYITFAEPVGRWPWASKKSG